MVGLASELECGSGLVEEVEEACGVGAEAWLGEEGGEEVERAEGSEECEGVLVWFVGEVAVCELVDELGEGGGVCVEAEEEAPGVGVDEGPAGVLEEFEDALGGSFDAVVEEYVGDAEVDEGVAEVGVLEELVVVAEVGGRVEVEVAVDEGFGCLGVVEEVSGAEGVEEVAGGGGWGPEGGGFGVGGEGCESESGVGGVVGVLVEASGGGGACECECEEECECEGWFVEAGEWFEVCECAESGGGGDGPGGGGEGECADEGECEGGEEECVDEGGAGEAALVECEGGAGEECEGPGERECDGESLSDVGVPGREEFDDGALGDGVGVGEASEGEVREEESSAGSVGVDEGGGELECEECEEGVAALG